MAKILNGPLAAGISGSIGNLTFLDTRFGQVVQKKPVGPVHTTTAALATKNRFRQAMLMMRSFGQDLRDALNKAAATSGTSQQGLWVGPMIKHIANQDWPFKPQYASVPHLIITNAFEAFITVEVTTNLSAAGAPYSAWWFYTKDGAITTVAEVVTTSPLLLPTVGLFKPPLVVPYWVHMIPFHTADPLSIGPGSAFEIT